MYHFFNNLSNIVSDPFFQLANQWESVPLLFALLLGVVGAAAPCQFTGNIGAITIYGNRSLQQRIPWKHILLFVAGKLIVFSGLGLVVWLLGQEFEANITMVIPWLRKAVGPVLIIIGTFMAGFWKVRGIVKFGEVPERYLKDSKTGSLLLGISFTLAFCPTMFILFFFTLMPVVVSTSYGAVLPSVFGLGTSIPLLLSVLLIWYFELGGTFMKQGRKIGRRIQQAAGWLLVILGILDTLIYW